MNATSRARRSGLQLQLALVVGAAALVLIHLSLTYAVLGELDRRLIVLDGGIAIVGLAVAFWYVGSLVEERQRHSLETVLIDVLTIPRDISDTANAALEVLMREQLAEAATIAVADDTDSAMHPIAEMGYPEGWLKAAEGERLPDVTERPTFIREREPHRWVAPLTESVSRQPWVARVPLLSGDDPIGLLLLTTRRANVLRDQHLLETIAVQLSAALDHAAMYEAAYQRERDLEEQDFRRLEFMAALSSDLATVAAGDEETAEDATADSETGESPDSIVTREELEEHIESPVQGVDRLNVLIDDLMDLGRSGFEYTVEPEEVDLVALVRRMCEGLSPAMAQRDLVLNDDMPRRAILAVTDQMLLEKVVLNVLSNATRHAPVGGEVTVSTRRVGDGRARIEIHDTGPRIDPEDRDRIFEPYYRVRRPDAAPVPGSGLGLAVARRIIETLDGLVWVDEREEVGARICIEVSGVLPLVATPSAPAAESDEVTLDAESVGEEADPSADVVDAASTERGDESDAAARDTGVSEPASPGLEPPDPTTDLPRPPERLEPRDLAASFERPAPREDASSTMPQAAAATPPDARGNEESEQEQLALLRAVPAPDPDEAPELGDSGYQPTEVGAPAFTDADAPAAFELYPIPDDDDDLSRFVALDVEEPETGSDDDERTAEPPPPRPLFEPRDRT